MTSDGCGATYPLLSAGSTRPVFHLPGSRPWTVTATVTAPPSAGPEVSLPQSPFSADGVEQDMDVSRSSFGDTLSQDGAGQFLLPSVPQDCQVDLQSYEYILKLVLADLGKSDLLVQDTHKPRSFWEVETETPTQSGGGALALDNEMQEELTAAFSEPSSSAKVISSSSPYKVPSDLYSALFKAPKVEEEMVKAAGNVRPLPINSDLRKAVETFYESSMATWRLGLHATLLSKYVYSKCGQDPVLEAVCKKLHGAIRESRQTSARGASVAIAAQRRLVVDASAFRDCRDLRSSLLATPFVGSSLFGGQFMSSVEAATRSQEQLSQARRLASAGSRAAQGSQAPKLAQQSQKRRAPPPPPSAPAASAAPQAEGGSGAKQRRGKNRGRSNRSTGNQAQPQAQSGARGRGVSNQRPPPNRR